MERARFASPWLADSLYTACVPASPAPGSPLRAGAVLDEKYRIARVLGSAGMGLVDLAEHLELERPVAVKFLLASALASEDGIARFRREAKALAKIESPNVVRVFDVGSLDGVGPYIVMEYLEGEDVAQILKREGRLSVSRACSLVIQAAKGLASAHAVGVVHRDVKPANLFVVPTADGREMVKVIDFGIAKLASAVDTVTESASFLGSPRFMSPEQVYGDKTIDARTDVWSLAVVLFEALAGKPAFGAESFAKVLTEIAIGKVPTLASFVTDAPLALDAVLAAALQKDAAKRTADVLAFARALAPFVSDARSFPLTPTANRDSIEPDVSTRPARRASPHNLLVEPNPFIGRSSDLQALAEAIESGARLVTLVGTAGTGKTRIALHFGWESLDRWPGGVWFCDLSDASTLAGVAFTVAGALGVPLEKGDPALELAHAIAGRGRCLLILDTFEQVTSEARTTIGQWIERTTEACFVVTSREVLRLDAERVLPLDPLERDEAVSLFEARAQAAKQGFSLTPSTRPVVQALVALLDHLPLAVELAAARVRVMAPASILERMTQRFKLLALPHEHRSRQATLRGALDWSWDLLAKDEQSALEQISVFEGGFTLEAAEAVLSLDELWTVDAVQALVDKSLLRRGRDGRFGLLVSVHEYAREKIDMSQRRAAAEARHGSYYARFGTDDARTSLDSHGGNERRRALLPEIDNLAVAAKRAAMRSDGPTAAHTALAAWTVFEQYGPYAVGIGLLDELGSEGHIAQCHHLLAVHQTAQFAPCWRLVEHGARIEAEQHPHTAGGGLRAHGGTERVLLFGEPDDAGIQIGAAVVLRQPETHRATAAAAHLTHPGQLGPGHGHVDVVAFTFTDTARRLEHAGTMAPEHIGEHVQLVGLRIGAGYRAAIGHPVQEGAARGEPERTGLHRLVEQIAHHSQVVGSRGRLVEAALTHGVLAQRTVAHHATHVHALRHAPHAGEIFAVGDPVPRQAAHDGIARNVFDAFHQLGQVLAIFGLTGRKGDAAVAHHHAGDAVVTTTRTDRVPGKLGVEVGMDVDETGRHQLALGVDVDSGAADDARGHRNHSIAGDSDIGLPGGCTRAVDHRAIANDNVVGTHV